MIESDTMARGTELQQGRLLDTIERLLSITATEVDASLDAASNAVSTVLGADKVDVFLYEESSESLVARGTTDTPMGRRQHQIGLNRLPLSNGGRAVEVFRGGCSFRWAHVEPDLEELRGIRLGLGVQSTIAAPLDVGGVRRGVLSIVSARVGAFSDDDLHFCEAVSRWIGMVLHRAELTERITRESAARARQVAADELILLLAHDLRGPLTPVHGYLDLLRRSAERDGRTRDQGYIAQAMTAMNRLSSMINEILDASRLEQGLFALETEPCDLSVLVGLTVDALRTPTATITVHTPDEGPVAQVDPRRVRQALENLISNALRHGPEGGPIVVSVDMETRDEVGWATVAVHDDGPGIAPEVRSTLFTRFARRANTKSLGLGLGLYLAHGIAQAHGGTLTVESQPGRGATFRLALPLEPGSVTM